MHGRILVRAPRALAVALALAMLAMLTAFATAPAADAGYAKRTLKKGSQGRDVKLHQRYLSRAGIRVRADGYYGRRTRRAQRRFERKQKRRRNGRASRSDQRKLRKVVRRKARERETRGSGGTPAVLQTHPGERAVLSPDGRTAIAPQNAPQEVKDAIAAANRITKKPYRYGGGHGKWEDSGYDCSGAVSYALHGAGLLKRPLPSGPMMRWGKRGRGDWITVYAHEGHAYVIIAGLRFDTSRGRGGGERGPRWRPERRSSRGFTARHPAGL